MGGEGVNYAMHVNDRPGERMSDGRRRSDGREDGFDRGLN